MTTRDHPSQCPYCGRRNEAQTNTTGHNAPKDGDLAMCFTCGRFSVIDGTRVEGMRVLTPSESFDVKRSKQCQDLYIAWFMTKHGIEKSGGLS